MVSSLSGKDEPKYLAVVSYPSGQDGAILLAGYYSLSPKKISFFFDITKSLLTKLFRRQRGRVV